MDATKYINGSKYSNLYFKIILKSQNSKRIKLSRDDLKYEYFENHHILPKSIFKEFGNIKLYKWNSVLLTAREHFICHALLVKHYNVLGKKIEFSKMSHAFKQLNGNNKYSSKLYEILQKDFSFTEEHKNNISISTTGVKKSKYIKNKLSDTHKRNISLSKMNHVHSEETKKKISDGNKGKKLSDKHIRILQKPKSNETKSKISSAIKGNHNGAKEIKIYNNEDVLLFVCKTGFRKFCEANNLPFSALAKSYQQKTKLYEVVTPNSKSRLESSGMIKYKGWYALAV